MFIVTANSYQELENLEKEKPEAILLPLEHVSIRQIPFFDHQGLVYWISRLHEKGIKVYINALKMIMEDELEIAREVLQMCKDLHADGIYIADEGYIHMAGQMGMIDKLIYQPETLIVNGMDADFYRDLGVQAVCLAHELSLEEIQEIARDSHAPLEVLVQGRYSWMYSRRLLLSNYLLEIGSEKHADWHKTYTLQEATREDLMPAVEDDSGTHIFSSAPITSIKQIQALKEAGIERFRIDTMFEDEDYGARQLRLYRKALEQGQIDEEEIIGDDFVYGNKTLVKKER